MKSVRENKLALNTIMGLVQQVVTIINGLILPRLILIHFGSSVNGLVSSITQFLALISLLDMGVGAVVQSNLYGPLVNGDEDQVSRIVVSAERFFRRIALALLAYVILLMVIFPYISTGNFDHVYIATLIGILAINSFAQYYFGITYRLLLNADQLSYIHMMYSTISIFLSTIICAVFIELGFGIHIVRLAGALVYLLQPFMINRYVLKHYNINKKIELNGEPIKQKWNGLAQHCATVILEHTDVAVLTIFSTLENVSIYAVYHMVIDGIRQLITSAMSGVKSYLGTLYARGNIEDINKQFDKIEWGVHSVVSLLFAVMWILIIPFVEVYTEGINDANYIVPVFASIMVLAQGVYCIRLPYNYMVQAAGQYKETQLSAIIEATLNVIISIVLVSNFGLIGVAIGTLIAMMYRTIYFAWYLSKNIIYRQLRHFIKQIIVDCIIIFIMIISTSWIKMFNISYLAWLLMAIEVFLICLIIMVVFNYLFYRKNLLWLFQNIKDVFLEWKDKK